MYDILHRVISPTLDQSQLVHSSPQTVLRVAEFVQLNPALVASAIAASGPFTVMHFLVYSTFAPTHELFDADVFTAFLALFPERPYEVTRLLETGIVSNAIAVDPLQIVSAFLAFQPSHPALFLVFELLALVCGKFPYAVVGSGAFVHIFTYAFSEVPALFNPDDSLDISDASFFVGIVDALYEFDAVTAFLVTVGDPFIALRIAATYASHRRWLEIFQDLVMEQLASPSSLMREAALECAEFAPRTHVVPYLQRCFEIPLQPPVIGAIDALVCQTTLCDDLFASIVPQLMSIPDISAISCLATFFRLSRTQVFVQAGPIQQYLASLLSSDWAECAVFLATTLPLSVVEPLMQPLVECGMTFHLFDELRQLHVASPEVCQALIAFLQSTNAMDCTNDQEIADCIQFFSEIVQHPFLEAFVQMSHAFLQSSLSLNICRSVILGLATQCVALDLPILVDTLNMAFTLDKETAFAAATKILSLRGSAGLATVLKTMVNYGRDYFDATVARFVLAVISASSTGGHKFIRVFWPLVCELADGAITGQFLILAVRAGELGGEAAQFASANPPTVDSLAVARALGVAAEWPLPESDGTVDNERLRESIAMTNIVLAARNNAVSPLLSMLPFAWYVEGNEECIRIAMANGVNEPIQMLASSDTSRLGISDEFRAELGAYLARQNDHT